MSAFDKWLYLQSEGCLSERASCSARSNNSLFAWLDFPHPSKGYKASGEEEGVFVSLEGAVASPSPWPWGDACLGLLSHGFWRSCGESALLSPCLKHWSKVLLATALIGVTRPPAGASAGFRPQARDCPRCSWLSCLNILWTFLLENGMDRVCRAGWICLLATCLWYWLFLIHHILFWGVHNLSPDVAGCPLSLLSSFLCKW